MVRAKRKVIDCRDFPNEIGCTLLISGSPKEILKVAVRHAVEEHGHKYTPELKKQIRSMMKEESKFFGKRNKQSGRLHEQEKK